MDYETKQHIIKALSKNVRLDGRKIDEFRDLTVEKNIINTAEGSARVKLGNTEVLAGVKLDLGTPYPDTPDEGTVMVNAEFTAMSNENFRLGPPDSDAIELARIVDRGIRESEAMDLKKLCVEKGEKVWMVMIDIVTINADGNLIDAAGIAALTALKNTVFPKLTEDGVDYKEKTKTKLILTKEPLPVTVYKIGEHLVVDPTFDEQQAAQARLTVASLPNGNICALQKGLEFPLTEEDINKILPLAISKAKELRKKL